MARNTLVYVVADETRDKGKSFVLTELPASQGEAWAIRALMAMMNAGIDIPDGFQRMPMAAMAQVGITALSQLTWDIAEPLLNEMWQCVTIRPDPSKPHVTRELIESDIEEISTRIKLRAEIWKLHVGFLKAVAPSVSNPSAPAAQKPSANTKTSRRQSAP